MEWPLKSQQQLAQEWNRLNPSHKIPVPHRGPKRKPDTTPGGPGLGYIQFVSYNFEGYDYQQYSFTALLGDGAPEITDGYGGWEAVSRPRRRAMTQWNGNNPLTIKIPIMFDAYAINDGLKIEADIRQLEKMAGAEINMKQPPLVLIDSNGVVPHDAHDATQNDWVIQNIEWGDSDRNEHGNRTRQACTVTLMEYVFDEEVGGIGQVPSGSSKGRAKKKAKRRHYVVKGASETLVTIAHHQLGNSHLWRRIRELNKRYKDPYKPITMGTTLVMPMKPSKKKKK